MISIKQMSSNLSFNKNTKIFEVMILNDEYIIISYGISYWIYFTYYNESKWLYLIWNR